MTDKAIWVAFHCTCCMHKCFNAKGSIVHFADATLSRLSLQIMRMQMIHIRRMPFGNVLKFDVAWNLPSWFLAILSIFILTKIKANFSPLTFIEMTQIIFLFIKSRTLLIKNVVRNSGRCYSTIIFVSQWLFNYEAVWFSSYFMYRDQDEKENWTLIGLHLYIIQQVLNLAWTPILYENNIFKWVFAYVYVKFRLTRLTYVTIGWDHVDFSVNWTLLLNVLWFLVFLTLCTFRVL